MASTRKPSGSLILASMQAPQTEPTQQTPPVSRRPVMPTPQGGRPDDAEREARLKAMKRRATGLLAVSLVIFIGASWFEALYPWLGYVRATAEASLVGGLADWFAVTALFRHPLGLPIPHTAVIPERKDQFGRTLGRFVQENLLTPALITDRVRHARIAARLSDWLADEAHAAA